MCYRVREPVGVVSWMCVVYDATLVAVLIWCWFSLINNVLVFFFYFAFRWHHIVQMFRHLEFHHTIDFECSFWSCGHCCAKHTWDVEIVGKYVKWFYDDTCFCTTAHHVLVITFQFQATKWYYFWIVVVTGALYLFDFVSVSSVFNNHYNHY